MSETVMQTYSQKNWQVVAGALLVVSVFLMGFFGPYLAPRDPLQENFVVFIDEQNFIKAPFPAFMVPGFPLGSDEFGRDILSRLLWGFRPTLILVIVVAGMRLILGVTIGMISGWTKNQLGITLNFLISMTGVMPVLFIALCVIAATGQKLGIWAFLIGLLITGWGDVARLIREQTRLTKSHLFIEAARAMGASNSQMLTTHVLPQIMPTVWMVLSFETSNTLLITAELGVLGYFINAIWIPVGDWVGLRTSGLPELGQMLGDLQKQPWGALGAGLFVFIAILGFNLLGDGISQWADPKQIHRKKSIIRVQITEWVDDRIFSRQAAFKRLAPIIFGLGFLLIGIMSGSIYLIQNQQLEFVRNIPPLPGNHLWASTFRDSQGTFWVPYKIPRKPILAWSLQLGSGISGSPVINSQGTLYVSTMDAKLHAISPEGVLLWSVDLPNQPVGTPALTASGLIYSSDIKGGLTVVGSDRTVSEIVKGTSQKSPALTGPISAEDSSVYFATTDFLFGITADGTVKWKKSIPTYSLTSPIIRLTRDGKSLILEDFLVSTDTGELLNKGTRDPMDRLIVGTDGKTYLLTQNYLELYQPGSSQSGEQEKVRWDARAIGTSFRYPYNSGISPDGKIWLQYSSQYEFTRIIWLDWQGVNLSIIDFPYRGSLTAVIAIDKENSTIVCGVLPSTIDLSQGLCQANSITSNSPIWELPVSGNTVGGALIENRFYLATSAGFLNSYNEEK